MKMPSNTRLTRAVRVLLIGPAQHPAHIISFHGQLHMEKSTPKLDTAHYRIQLKVTYYKD